MEDTDATNSLVEILQLEARFVQVAMSFQQGDCRGNSIGQNELFPLLNLKVLRAARLSSMEGLSERE